MDFTELGIALPHLAERQFSALAPEFEWNLPDWEVERDGVHVASIGQIPGSSQRRMSRELQLFLGGKYADLDALVLFHLCIARKDERGLREIGLASDRLHLLSREPPRIREYRQLIAFQRTRGENIHVHVREP